jgi:hypothetical protein
MCSALQSSEAARIKEPHMPTSINTLDIKPQGLGACLEGNFLRVPKYQRAYSWDDEHVAEFLADINTSFSDDAPEYFMGSVVLQGAAQKYEVVDGQQRLTTATIFIAAVRDFLAGQAQGDVARSLEGQFLQTKDTWSQQVNPRMTLSVYDHEFFLKRVLNGQDVKPSRESHERIAAAQTQCKAFLESIGQHFTNWFDRISALVKYVEHQTRIIQVIVPSDANAYVIFETLNDRGKDLSASDLLKNHLFGVAAERLEEVQASWNQMLGVLEAHGGDDILITYIRQLWSATREVAREKELFSKIKQHIASSQQAVDFSSELVQQANNYSAMLNASHPLWKEIGGNADSIIASLNTLKVERFRPAMLALLTAFTGEELVKAMRYILNGSVRYLIAVGAGGGTLEATWSDVARKVTTKEITTAATFAKEMMKIVPNDEVFRSSFAVARISKSFLGRYFLTSLERHARGEKNSELVPNGDVAAVNLEHILPENPGDHWPGLHPELAAAFSRRIGNQVLLSAKKNSELGNAGYEVKRPVLQASDFVLTRKAGENESWGPEQIEKRQAQLAEMAVAVWSYNV